MGINKKLLVLCITVILLSMLAYAAIHTSYVDNYFAGHSLYNISNITITDNYFGPTSAAAFKNENFTVRYDARTDRFLNENFTVNYDARTDRFGNANFTALMPTLSDYQNVSAVFNLANFSSAIGLILPDLQNVSAVYNQLNFTNNYDARTDRFLNENFTNQLSQNMTKWDLNLGWTNLTNYPAACPANTWVSTLEDAVICTGAGDIFVLDTGDNLSGFYNHTAGNWSMAENGTHCYGWNCEGQIYYNGSSLVIKMN